MQREPRNCVLPIAKMFLMPDLEPFADKIWCTEGALSPPQYRIGYRSSTTRSVLAQLEVPADIIERTVLSKLLVVPRITSDGTVTADIPGQSDLISDNWLEVAAVPINELVLRATTLENLRLEEAKISDLKALENLLDQSIAKVRAAIAIVAKAV
jgi:hypothetical protein